jgi:2-amino-4-hydroxy-6-hydroxymethyldihydropteridine diphosphokinase
MFFNAVAELRTDIGAQQLLGLMKEIETKVGRMPDKHWGPREVDLDLLLYGTEVIDEPDLVVPHPELTKRAFVLVPLLEIDRELSIPGAGEARMHDMMLGRAGVRLAFPPHLL